MKILVSGLLNIETTVAVREFPINYYPIDYPFFGVNSAPSGVAYNIALALSNLGDNVRLASMLGDDFPADHIKHSLVGANIEQDNIKTKLSTTPSSVVLYDTDGRRQIYCDLKDIQDTAYGFDESILTDIDLVCACNINFNRPLLYLAKQKGIKIATDVHALSNPNDEYNREFMALADILFVSDESVGENYRDFIYTLANVYHNEIIVLGRGSKGASIYTRSSGQIIDLAAYTNVTVVNTVGAGDALFSAFLHFYSKGFSPIEALRRAEIFAALKIRENGASKGFVNESEIDRIINVLQHMCKLLKNIQHTHTICVIVISLQTLKEAW